MKNTSVSEFVKQNTTNRTPFAVIRFNFNNNRSESFTVYSQNQITKLINNLKSNKSLFADTAQILVIQRTTNPSVNIITAEYKLINNKLINTVNIPIPIFDSININTELIPITEKIAPTENNIQLTDIFHR